MSKHVEQSNTYIGDTRDRNEDPKGWHTFDPEREIKEDEICEECKSRRQAEAARSRKLKQLPKRIEMCEGCLAEERAARIKRSPIDSKRIKAWVNRIKFVLGIEDDDVPIVMVVPNATSIWHGRKCAKLVILDINSHADEVGLAQELLERYPEPKSKKRTKSVITRFARYGSTTEPQFHNQEIWRNL